MTDRQHALSIRYNAAAATAEIIEDQYDVVILDSPPHPGTADFAQDVLLQSGRPVAVVDLGGRPVVLGSLRQEKPWVVVANGHAHHDAADALDEVDHLQRQEGDGLIPGPSIEWSKELPENLPSWIAPDPRPRRVPEGWRADPADGLRGIKDLG